MKKKISLFIATVLTVVALPVATFAAAATTDISGVVTDNGNPVDHAHVIVICDNNKKSTFTDNTGTYLVHYKAALCPAGSTANVTATKGKKGGNDSKTVNAQTNKLNVALINVSLPEFGLITAVGATLVGAGAILAIRHRQISGHQA